jgi:hypothetical protein
MADLAISRELAVYKQIEAGVHAFKVQKYLFVQHFGMNEEFSNVKSARSVIRNKGRVKWYGIAGIDVVWCVITATESGLPGARHVDLVHSANSFGVLNFGYVGKGIVENKIPIAAKGDEIFAFRAVICQRALLGVIGDKICSGSLAAHVQAVEILKKSVFFLCEKRVHMQLLLAIIDFFQYPKSGYILL